MLTVYSLTIFCGALLLFGVQPMFARLILPQLGGSPAVWNTAMVFFQAALLAGYAYAHVSTTRLEPRRHAILHFVVLLAPLFLLPLAVPAGWSPPIGGSPVAWLLGVMALTVGLPFLALSTTSPVLQKWFSGTGHAQAHDPYFLYVASNAGSLLSLLAYPILIEPHFTLVEQGRWWTAGYAIFVVLVSVCALSLFRKKPPERERAALAADTALERPETHTPSPVSRPAQAAASTPSVMPPPTPTAPPTSALR